MKISFSPIRRDSRSNFAVSGDVLTVDGINYDFGPLNEGDTLPRSAVSGDWLASDVTRESGEIALTVYLPHGVRAPSATRFPSPVTVTDGAVSLPPYEVKE
jgi:hypothetical protein